MNEKLRPQAQNLFELYFKDSAYFAQAFVQKDSDGRVKKLGYQPVEVTPTVDHVMVHLNGGPPIGDYTVRQGNLVRYILWDVDATDLQKARNIVQAICEALGNLPHYVFYSGNKGYHVAVFLLQPIPAKTARRFGIMVRTFSQSPSSGDPHVEVYPKQDELTSKEPKGNLIKLPGCIHPKTGKRSVYIDIARGWEEGEPLPLEKAGKNKASLDQILCQGRRLENPIQEIINALDGVWEEGRRDPIGFPLVGYLAKAGWEEEQVQQLFADLVEQKTGDPEKWRKNIERVFKRLAEGDDVQGWQGLKEELKGEPEVLQQIVQLVERNSKTAHKAATLEEVLSRLDEIVPGVENTPLGEALAWLSKPEANIVAKNIKESRPTDRDAYNKTISLIAKCAKSMRTKRNQKLSAGRPIIEVAETPLDDMRAQLIAAVHRANKLDIRNPFVYFYNGSLARIVRDEEGQLVAKLLTVPALRGIAADVALWTQGKKPTVPPKVVIEDLLSYDKWDFPGLKRIASHPVLLPDGTVDNKEGYSHQTRLYIEGSVILGDTSPTLKNVEAAKALLLDFWLGDFPFVDQASRANALGLFLLPFVRDLFEGATPLHLIDAATRRTGKTLLVDLYSIVTTGLMGAHTTLPEGEEELRKKITSLLLEGSNLISLDNVTTGQIVGGSALASYLTAGRSKDRILGKTETPVFKNYATWTAMGNNLQATGEIIGRSVWIRLDANLERPELRTGFKCENIRQWTRDNRSNLCTALLTLCRKWVAEGKPLYRGSAKGGFEEWLGTVGGILQSVGVEGFLQNDSLLQETSNPQEEAWRSFVRVWWERYGGEPVTLDKIFPIASRRDHVPTQPVGFGVEAAIDMTRESTPSEDLNLLESELRSPKESGRRVALSKMLNNDKRDVVISGCKIMKGSRTDNKQQWYLKRVEDK